MSEELRESRKNGTLLKTEGTGWDCGSAVRFLASPEARWITGKVLLFEHRPIRIQADEARHNSHRRRWLNFIYKSEYPNCRKSDQSKLILILQLSPFAGLIINLV